MRTTKAQISLRTRQKAEFTQKLSPLFIYQVNQSVYFRFVRTPFYIVKLGFSGIYIISAFYGFLLFFNECFCWIWVMSMFRLLQIHVRNTYQIYSFNTAGRLVHNYNWSLSGKRIWNRGTFLESIFMQIYRHICIFASLDMCLDTTISSEKQF